MRAGSADKGVSAKSRAAKGKRRNRAGRGDPTALNEYSARRAFHATPEPPPKIDARDGPLLFVIQQHAARRLHYDFRLECDSVLKSWAVPKGPSLDVREKRLAVPTEDHPFDYASFEGIIQAGQYGAGQVIVWDCGVYSPDEGQEYWFHDRAEAERRVREGIEQGKLSILLRGEKVKGSFALVRTSDKKSWLLIKHKDRYVTETDVTEQNRSVLCGLSVQELKFLPVRRMPASRLVANGKGESMPKALAPMHGESADAPFTDPDWMWEPKLDGYRVLAYISEGEVKLRSRRGLDLTQAFPLLVAELGQQAARHMILDGEIVAFDSTGKPSFSALQNRVMLQNERDVRAADRNVPTVLFCFDLLHFEGLNLRDAPYRDRRRYLAQCLLPSTHVQLVHAAEDGAALYRAALDSGFEGVVGKRKESAYQPGRRSPSWLKIKSALSADFVIGGYTKGKGSRERLGALLLGYWDGDELHYASHVGSGFDEDSLAQVKARLDPLERKNCPFVENPELHSPTTWVEPELVAEVSFQRWTEDGSLRAPVFVRLRDDIEARSVRRPEPGHPPVIAAAGAADPASEIEAVLRQLDTQKTAFTLAIGPHQIRLTHLDRVYWPADPTLEQPALTKRDLLRYFAQVSPFILPHLEDRPLTMIRMPEGINGQRFYQKHWEQERPDFVETITVFSEHKDDRHDYLLCNNLPTLLWLAQSGTLEYHVWHSRAKLGSDAASESTDYATSLKSLAGSVLNFPDYVVFDLDPYIYSGKEAPGDEPELNTVAFEKGKEVAFWLRELLAEMSLEAVVKTSGKTGLHVFVPIQRTIDFDAARQVSEMVGRHLMRGHPKDITLEWSVRQRTGKIFMDYNMNVRGKTLNVAYSPRGAPGAPVSMPLTWEELASAHPLDFRVTNVAQRVQHAGDPWRDVLRRKQSLERALGKAKT
jgi:bifunctional non-homologous end joining protein LigD